MAISRIIGGALSLALFASIASAQRIDVCSVGAVCYVLDQSDSVNSTEYAQLQEFVVETARAVGAQTANTGTDTQYSAVGFATEVATIVNPTTDLEGEFIPEIESSDDTRLNGFTNIYAGLNQCRPLLQQANQSTPRVLVLVTDGQHNEGGTNPINDIKNEGITVITVGVGNGTNATRLEEWATIPEYAVTVNFTDIIGLVERVTESTCEAQEVPPSPTPSNSANVSPSPSTAESNSPVPSPSNTPSNSPTISPTASNTPTTTPTPSNTPNSSPTPSNSLFPSPCVSPMPSSSTSVFPSLIIDITVSPSPSNSPTVTPSISQSSSSIPSTTPTVSTTMTAFPSETSMPTMSSMPTITPMPTETAMLTMTATAAPSGTMTMTATASPSSSPIAATILPTEAATPSATSSTTSTPSESSSVPPTMLPTTTATASASASPEMVTQTATATATASPTMMTQTATASPTMTATASTSASPTMMTQTATATATAAPTTTATASASASPEMITQTATATAVPTTTATASASASPEMITQTATATASPTMMTQTATASPTMTATASASASPTMMTQTATASPIMTTTATASASPTISVTPSATPTQATVTPSPLTTDVLSLIRPQCETEFAKCDFNFDNSTTLQTYRIPGNPDQPFTGRITYKTQFKHVGVVNTGKFEPEFIDANGVATVLSQDGATPPFVPTALKALTLGSSTGDEESMRINGSGIGHQFLLGDQTMMLQQRCVRVSFNAWQMLGLDGTVMGNMNLDAKSDRACVVFLTDLPIF